MRKNLKKFYGELVDAKGIIKAVSFTKGDNKKEKVMLLRNVVISNKHGEVKVDHMWLKLPEENKKIKINSLFSGIGHIGKYHKKMRTNMNNSLDYCLILH